MTQDVPPDAKGIFGSARSGPTAPVSSSKDEMPRPVPALCCRAALELSDLDPELDWELDELSLPDSLDDSDEDSEPLSDSEEDSDLLPDSDPDSLSLPESDSEAERLPDSLVDPDPDPEDDSLPLLDVLPELLALSVATSVNAVLSIPLSFDVSDSELVPEFVIVTCLENALA